MEQAPEVEQVVLASAYWTRGILFAEAAEPAEQMGIAAQLARGGATAGNPFGDRRGSDGRRVDSGAVVLGRRVVARVWIRASKISWNMGWGSGGTWVLGGSRSRGRGGKSSARMSPGCRGWPCGG